MAPLLQDIRSPHALRNLCKSVFEKCLMSYRKSLEAFEEETQDFEVHLAEALITYRGHLSQVSHRRFQCCHPILSKIRHHPDEKSFILEILSHGPLVWANEKGLGIWQQLHEFHRFGVSLHRGFKI